MLEWVVSHPYLMPFIIAIMRVLDVSFGTIRIMFVVRGQQYYARVARIFRGADLDYGDKLDHGQPRECLGTFSVMPPGLLRVM